MPANAHACAGDVVKMRANLAEVPYVFERSTGTAWSFTLLYSPLTALLPMAQELAAAARKPQRERNAILEVGDFHGCR